MTFGDTILAVLWALCIWRVLDVVVDYIVGYFRQKKVDRILDELHEFWDAVETKKPVRKKAVAKKK